MPQTAAMRSSIVSECPAYWSVLKAGNHRLRGANLLGELRLSQPRILPHLAHQ